IEQNPRSRQLSSIDLDHLSDSHAQQIVSLLFEELSRSLCDLNIISSPPNSNLDHL
ncbi:hypothetical protein Leryth_016983, partial [Lithospermum erythrorhizon]